MPNMKDKRIGIIFITVFIDLVGFGIIIPLNPYLARVYGASPLQVGLLMGVYSLFQFIFSPIWGQLSDRYGRRPIILLSLLGAALAHTGFGLATSFTGLVVARAMAGLFGGNISTAMAYIADITEAKNRSQGMGLIGAAFGLGFLLGPFVGGVSANVMGSPSAPAFLAGGICFLNFLVAVRFLPESLTDRTPSRERPSRLKLIASAFVSPVLGPVLFLVFLNTFAMAHIEAQLFLYVQDLFSWTLAQASFGFAYVGLILVFTQGFLIRRWMPKCGERRLLLGGLVLSAIGFFLIGLSESVSLLAVAVTVLALGNGLVNPSLNGSVSLLSGKEIQGNNLGVAQSLSSIARILGPPTGGYLYQAAGVQWPFFAASSLVVIAVLITLTLRHRLPEGGRQSG